MYYTHIFDIAKKEKSFKKMRYAFLNAVNPWIYRFVKKIRPGNMMQKYIFGTKKLT